MKTTTPGDGPFDRALRIGHELARDISHRASAGLDWARNRRSGT